MKLYLKISVAVTLSVLAVAITVYAASSGHASASRVTYQVSGATAALKFYDNVRFSYSGYEFKAKSGEIIIPKPDESSERIELISARFSGGVDVRTPNGGHLRASKLALKNNSGVYDFTGGMLYNENNLTIKASRFSFNNSSGTITATGGVQAEFISQRGIRGEDGREHIATMIVDSLVYNFSDRTIRSSGSGRPEVSFDGLSFIAGNMTLTLSDDSLVGLIGADDISISGEGIELSGINASYEAESGKLKVYGDVKYSRGNDKLEAEAVTWHLYDEGNHITLESGRATMDLGNNMGTESETVHVGGEQPEG